MFCLSRKSEGRVYIAIILRDTQTRMLYNHLIWSPIDLNNTQESYTLDLKFLSPSWTNTSIVFSTKRIARLVRQRIQPLIQRDMLGQIDIIECHSNADELQD